MKRILLATMVWGVCLLSLEAALQLLYRARAGSWLPQRTALPVYAAYGDAFRLRPNLRLKHGTSEFQVDVVTDARGFRRAAARAEVPFVAGEDTPRVLVLGPSFAFGWGVEYEEAFPARLALLLSDDLGPIEVINAGVPALGPQQQLDWFAAEGARLHPDLVIQTIYGSLEVSRAYSDGLRVTPEGFLEPADATPADRLRASLKKSALVFHGWSAWTSWQRGRTGEVAGAGRPLAAEFDASGAEVAEVVASFYVPLRDAVAAAGAELLVVYLPLSYRVHPEDLARWRHLGVVSPAAADAQDAAYAEALAAVGVPLLDLRPALAERATAGERLYYEIDIHWNAAGHSVAADAIAAYLRGAWRP